jgi:zinc protease
MTSKPIKRCAFMVAALLFAMSSFAQLRLPAGYYWKQLPNGLQVLVIV